jgi:hypothetical protein
MGITSHERLRIAAQAVVCERTVVRVYSGGGTDYSRLRVTKGATELNLPLPPERSTDSLPSSPTPSPASSSRT